MKATLKAGLHVASANLMHIQEQKAFKRPVLRILTLSIIVGMASTGMASSQTSHDGIDGDAPRIITSSTGEAIGVRLINKSADSVEVIRLNDSKRIHIPLNRLSEADRKSIANWSPSPVQSYRPSSVSIAGSPGIQRKSYPSNVAPRYISGATRSGGRLGGSVRTYTQSCTGRTVTIVTPGNCPGRPCP